MRGAWSGNELFSLGHAGADLHLWWYILSSQVFFVIVAIGCSCNLLTALESAVSSEAIPLHCGHFSQALE